MHGVAAKPLRSFARHALALTPRWISCLEPLNSATSFLSRKPTRTPKPLWGRCC